LLVAASSYLGNIGRQIGPLRDPIFVFSIDTLYPFVWLLLGLVLVAITAGLLAALVRPLWICFIAFALASLAVSFIRGLNLICIVLAVRCCPCSTGGFLHSSLNSSHGCQL